MREPTPRPPSTSRPAADRHRPARGERRHRQDLDDRRARHALRRRGVRRLEEMLVVTFGRAASQELRERVRAQLVEAERVLSDDAPRGPGPSRRREPAARRGRRRAAHGRHRRVTEALAGFDAATIATTHQFCSMVLDSLGVAGDTDSRRPPRRGPRRPGGRGGRRPLPARVRLAEGGPVFTYGEALAIARAVVGTRRPASSRSAEDRADPAGRRVAFAGAVREEIDRRKRRLGILSYDDLLCQLADALEADDAPAASGCGSGGGSCWSTSSRTPTRCSGRCSTGRSPATPRWC